ncbi:MAG: exo-alpha-sialidase [Planctomycetota bacterium]
MKARSTTFATLLLLAAWAGTVSAGENLAARFEGELSAFLGKPHFVLRQLYGMDKKEERGGRNIITAWDGTVLAFDGPRVRRSADGGETWSEPIEIGPKANGCNAVVDEATGAVMLIHPDGHRLISSDAGQTWKEEAITVHPNLIEHGSSEKKNLDAGCMQPGVTLLFGDHKGRLLMPVRWIPSNALPWRPYIYNTAIYSDDHGKTWRTTAPFPVFGTGEAALAEISDGRILYSSREHMSRGNRFFAWSHDGGERWINFWRSDILPDGARGTSYGCMGGLIRLPVKGRDILVYSNLDTDQGVMPPVQQAGASRGGGREKITVWASFDGGDTWPIKRLVFDGPSAYSNLGVGRPGTSSGGRILLSFEGGEAHRYAGIHVAAFNLGWLLGGEKTGHGEVPTWATK